MLHLQFFSNYEHYRHISALSRFLYLASLRVHATVAKPYRLSSWCQVLPQGTGSKRHPAWGLFGLVSLPINPSVNLTWVNLGQVRLRVILPALGLGRKLTQEKQTLPQTKTSNVEAN